MDYARYILTGYIFEESEASLSTGNRTMYAIPRSLGSTKLTHENFYYTLDIMQAEVSGFVITGSLKSDTDHLMMKKVEKLKEMVNRDQLRMSFEQAKMSLENQDLISRIKKMNPYTIDWSNLVDYCSREEFLAMAKGSSAELTVHFMHSMNWSQRVLGTFIGDYDSNQRLGIVKGSHEGWIAHHKLYASCSSSYRFLERDAPYNPLCTHCDYTYIHSIHTPKVHIFKEKIILKILVNIKKHVFLRLKCNQYNDL